MPELEGDFTTIETDLKNQTEDLVEYCDCDRKDPDNGKCGFCRRAIHIDYHLSKSESI